VAAAPGPAGAPPLARAVWARARAGPARPSTMPTRASRRPPRPPVAPRWGGGAGRAAARRPPRHHAPLHRVRASANGAGACATRSSLARPARGYGPPDGVLSRALAQSTSWHEAAHPRWCGVTPTVAHQTRDCGPRANADPCLSNQGGRGRASCRAERGAWQAPPDGDRPFGHDTRRDSPRQTSKLTVPGPCASRSAATVMVAVVEGTTESLWRDTIVASAYDEAARGLASGLPEPPTAAAQQPGATGRTWSRQHLYHQPGGPCQHGCRMPWWAHCLHQPLGLYGHHHLLQPCRPRQMRSMRTCYRRASATEWGKRAA